MSLDVREEQAVLRFVRLVDPRGMTRDATLVAINRRYESPERAAPSVVTSVEARVTRHEMPPLIVKATLGPPQRGEWTCRFIDTPQRPRPPRREQEAEIHGYLVCFTRSHQRLGELDVTFEQTDIELVATLEEYVVWVPNQWLPVMSRFVSCVTPGQDPVMLEVKDGRAGPVVLKVLS